MTKKIDRDELKKLYCDEHLLTEEIQDRLGISGPTLYSYLRRYGLFRPRRKPAQEKNVDYAVSQYSEGKTIRQIARELHTDQRKVANMLRSRGVVVNNSEAHKIRTDYRLPETLNRLYIEQGMSTIDIAKLAGVNKKTVRQWLQGAGIPIRDVDVAIALSSAQGKRSMEKNPSWKGGRTVDKSGYILVKMPGHPLADERGYVKEHILVATGGDPAKLPDGHLVHHLDLDKQNNVPENLRIMPKSQHQLAHYELECLAAELVKSGVIVFEDGHYRFAESLHS